MSGLSRTLSLAQGVHPLKAQRNPVATHQHTPKMAPIIQDLHLILDQGQNPGPVPIEVHEDTTPALVPALTDAVPGADLVAGTGEGAIAVLPCQIAAGILATGPTQTPTTV